MWQLIKLLMYAFQFNFVNFFDISVENSTEYGNTQYFWKLDGSDGNIRYA